MSDVRDGPVNRPASSQPSQHRLATVSASQALQQHAVRPPVPLGLTQIDKLLFGASPPGNESHGLRRGHVLELYGPPGAGKTTLSISAVASCLRRQGRVTWIDAGTRLAIPRLRDVLRHADEEPDAKTDHDPSRTLIEQQLTHLTHYSTPSIAHLLTLMLHPPTDFLPEGTELLVIDSLASLIDASYPRTSERSSLRKNDGRSAADRRRNIIRDVANSLTRVAAIKNIAVVVSNHMVTQIRAQAMSALLRPALTTLDWENAMSSRVVMFRDWGIGTPSSQVEKRRGVRAVRFARVLKAAGSKLATNRDDTLIAFDIHDSGPSELPDINIANIGTDPAFGAPLIPAKRGHKDEGAEDSDEEYGWTEDDVQLASEGLVDERFLTAREVKDGASADVSAELPNRKKRRASEAGVEEGE